MEKKKNGHMLPQVGERHPFFCLVMLKGIGWNKAWPASACLCMCVCVCVCALGAREVGPLPQGSCVALPIAPIA